MRDWLFVVPLQGFEKTQWRVCACTPPGSPHCRVLAVTHSPLAAVHANFDLLLYFPRPAGLSLMCSCWSWSDRVHACAFLHWCLSGSPGLSVTAWKRHLRNGMEKEWRRKWLKSQTRQWMVSNWSQEGVEENTGWCFTLASSSVGPSPSLSYLCTICFCFLLSQCAFGCEALSQLVWGQEQKLWQ